MKFTTAYWILLVAFFLPVLCAGIAKAGRRDYDNANPRSWEESLQGYRQRAVAAMNNSFEALPFFAAAVVIAHQTGAAQSRLDLLAAVWLALRLVYVGLYVANLAGLRSLVWLAGVVTTVWIFVLGA
jgi:uncharacterized MAPEG superfamily protein